MAKGKLYGVGVGPGDPELLTLRAARILQEADCIAAPNIGDSARAALHIIEHLIQGKELIDATTPMTNDAHATGNAYDGIADQIAEVLDEGKSVAFVTLGDPSIYSTWPYLCQRMEGRGYEIEVVAGVPSFCAVAATVRTPLCERSEQLLVSPVAAGDPEAALAVPGTKVFMKSGRKLEDLRDALRGHGIAGASKLVANCGLEGEEVVHDMDAADELPSSMSVVIVKDGRLVAPLPEPHAHEDFLDVAERIAGPDEEARQRSFDKWNGVAKPIGSLGVLEDDVMRLASIVGTEDVTLDKRIIVVLCADNGVVAEGVTQCGQDVTTVVAGSVARGISSVCKMAAPAHIDTLSVDMGMAEPSDAPGVVDRAIARGTANIAQGPAMTREQALEAIRTGMDLVADLKSQGYDIIATGEMGIGNTTTSSAMAAAFMGLPVEEVTGRGAGLSNEGLARKVSAIKRALEVNDPDPDDALDVLSKLGGFDIAGMVGMYLGAAVHRVPIIIDGYISALAAYTAMRLCPTCTYAMLASHVSAEPAAHRLLDALGVAPAIQAGMRLGEGSGAVCLVPMLDMALSLYDGTTFADSGIMPYEVGLS